MHCAITIERAIEQKSKKRKDEQYLDVMLEYTKLGGTKNSYLSCTICMLLSLKRP